MTAKTQSPNGDPNAEQSTNELSRRRFLGEVGVVVTTAAATRYVVGGDVSTPRRRESSPGHVGTKLGGWGGISP